MDGMDAALVETDGDSVVRFISALTRPYDAATQALLWEAIEAAKSFDSAEEAHDALSEAEAAVTGCHAAVVSELLDSTGTSSSDIDAIGFHGQTVLHRPEAGFTVQLGNGAALAQACGCTVVNDFRSNDMANGGEGAPFAPVYHVALAQSLAERPVVFVNVGGVANVTCIPARGAPLAFDTGPGNGMIDEWMMRHTSQHYDAAGACAARGRVDDGVLAQLLDNAYFRRPPPKSLDRFAFSAAVLEGMSLEDGAATLTAFSAGALAAACSQLPNTPELWVICGGGRHNETLMRALEERLPGPVVGAEEAGFRGDSLEAEAFAYLAVRSLRGLPLSYPTTTGVSAPVSGGVVYAA